MRKMNRTFRDLWANEEAATMVEYVLLLALIAMVAAVGYGTFGTTVGDESDGVAVEVAEKMTPK